MRPQPILLPILFLAGCAPHLRVGSPQFQRAPELTCIVIIESPDKISAEVAQAAVNACRDAMEKGKLP